MTNRLLIIEDNKFYLELLRRSLDPVFDVSQAMTLAEATACISKGPYDAILLDLELPDSPRDQTMRAVKRLAPNTAIVALSGFSSPELIEDTIKGNASQFLVKFKDDENATVLQSQIRIAIKTNQACREAAKIGVNQ